MSERNCEEGRQGDQVYEKTRAGMALTGAHTSKVASQFGQNIRINIYHYLHNLEELKSIDEFSRD